MEHGSQHPYRTLMPLLAPLHRSSRGSGPHTSLVRVYCSNLCAASHNRILVRISSWRHVWMAGSLDQFIRRSQDPAQGRHTTKGAVRNVRSFGSRATHVLSYTVYRVMSDVKKGVMKQHRSPIGFPAYRKRKRKITPCILLVLSILVRFMYTF